MLSAALVGVSLIAGAASADDGMGSAPSGVHAQHPFGNEADVRRSVTEFAIPDVTGEVHSAA